MRQFIHSGIVDGLIERGYGVVVVGPGSTDTPQAEKQVPTFRRLDLELGRIRHRYFLARQQLVLNRTDTLKQKMKRLRETHPSAAAVAMIVRALISIAPFLRRCLLRWEYLMLRDSATEQLIRDERPDLVLLGSPGYVPQDAVLLHAARKHDIPTATAVLSWDNLSSKGLINPQPDRLLVWSEHMKNEAIKLHGFDNRRIVETGAIIYDTFATAACLGSKEDHFRQLRLDPNRKLIFYGTNHSGLFSGEVEVVKKIAEWVEQDDLGMPCQLWVRLHPQAVGGPFAVNVDAYMRLASPRVRIEIPPVQESRMLWELPKADLKHLVHILRDADIVINAGSTISLDAAVLDRPVVAIAYDAECEVPYHRSLRRVYGFTHMANVVRAGAVQLATSEEVLKDNIVRYLNDPTLDREGRRKIVAQQFGRT